MRAPPSSPYQTKAAIPLYVRPMRSDSHWRALGLGAEETPAKTINKMFWPALGGVVAAVWFFSRTQQPQKSPSK